MIRHLVPMIALGLLSSQLKAAELTRPELTKIERKLNKEPKYAGSPRYMMLVLGPKAADRVWIVADGNTLYVDKNGDGDLTNEGEKFKADKGSAEDGYVFEIPKFTVGTTTVHSLRVYVMPLSRLLFGDNANRNDLKTALVKDARALVLQMVLVMDAPHLKKDKAVTIGAGGIDPNGAMILAHKAADAPITHAAGPLEITFLSERTPLRRNRSTELVTTVGTSGLGAGSFAALCYDQVIPDEVKPKVEIIFAPAKSGESPIKKIYELPKRC